MGMGVFLQIAISLFGMQQQVRLMSQWAVMVFMLLLMHKQPSLPII